MSYTWYQVAHSSAVAVVRYKSGVERNSSAGGSSARIMRATSKRPKIKVKPFMDSNCLQGTRSSKGVEYCRGVDSIIAAICLYICMACRYDGYIMLLF